MGKLRISSVFFGLGSREEAPLMRYFPAGAGGAPAGALLGGEDVRWVGWKIGDERA